MVEKLWPISPTSCACTLGKKSSAKPSGASHSSSFSIHVQLPVPHKTVVRFPTDPGCYLHGLGFPLSCCSFRWSFCYVLPGAPTENHGTHRYERAHLRRVDGYAGENSPSGSVGDEVVDQQTLGPENASFSGGTNDSEHVNTLRNARHTHITTTEIL